MSDETPPPAKPAAGWYDDPSMVNTRRYWDGEKWTEHRQEASSSPAATPPSSTDSMNTIRVIALVALGVVILVGAIIGIRALVNQANKFTVKGELSLSGEGGTDGNACSGSGGYDDIEGGATVVIRDSHETQIGLGSLEEGTSQDGDCVFSFTVDGVPDKGKLYSVEVTHRGKVTFKKSEAEDVFLTLG